MYWGVLVSSFGRPAHIKNDFKAFHCQNPAPKRNFSSLNAYDYHLFGLLPSVAAIFNKIAISRHRGISRKHTGTGGRGQTSAITLYISTVAKVNKMFYFDLLGVSPYIVRPYAPICFDFQTDFQHSLLQNIILSGHFPACMRVLDLSH